nr:transcriptional regulator [Streptomyces olivoverticillatus]
MVEPGTWFRGEGEGGTVRETDRFAELMRELKERSGRSYGTLAKRLHSSTSTLHRYCNGATVPSDYAPVERFAKVCGASADELVALHRQWILAVAERRRATASATEDTGPVPVEPETAAAPDGEAAPPPVVEPTTVRIPEAGTGRRRRLLLAAAAAVATTVVAGTAVAVSSLGGSHSGAASPAVRHSASRAASHEGTLREAAGTVTADGRSSSPAATPTPSAQAASRAASPHAAEEKAAAGSSPDAAAADPFTVNVLPDNWESPCDQWFALDQEPGKVPPPPARHATDGWAAALHAVPAGHLRMQVTVQGTDNRPVVLHALYVHVDGARKAPRWNAYTMGSGCGGALAPASFAVDLDDAVPRPRPVPGREGERPTSSTDFPYKVSVNDPQVLNIDASTLGQDVSWYLVLAWSSGDRQGTTRIDDHGRPFRTVALNTDHRYWYNAGPNAWAQLSS